jgi:hypothetical protein
MLFDTNENLATVKKELDTECRGLVASMMKVAMGGGRSHHFHMLQRIKELVTSLPPQSFNHDTHPTRQQDNMFF